ncbi:hypothetical protein [Pararhizobium sp.]|uniref:hypothetical protein n=1 Tax=Pararhizobium sp. TaxID=1977563 RepID=UPI0027243B82|nr:hypothetical protein [Pararhizobium sp.]MDO9416994.1 hypothetical protein [Pararhizobium sp.]
MATAAEDNALNIMVSAVETLRSQLAVNWSAETRRNHLKAAMDLIMDGARQIVSEAHELADPDYLDVVGMDRLINMAFADAIESEELNATDFTPSQRLNGTMSHQVQGI